MQIAVTGATGRMGGNVIETVEESLDHEISFVVDREEQELENGLKVYDHERFGELLEENKPDVVIDFTVPEGALYYAEKCASSSTAFVTGTTGFTEEQFQQLEEYSSETQVLRASNFSQGINVLRQIVREAVNKLPEYEVEVVESHHSGKIDSPSGTAKTIVDDIEDEKDGIERVHGREGEQPREDDEVGIHAIRAGNIKGTHEVIMAGNDEVLKLRHESGSRQVFVEGALTAAEWVVDQKTGYYSFEEVLE